MKKEERLRREGLAFAVRYLKDHTAKELEEEARRRGAWDIPLAIPDSVLDDYSRRVKEMAVDTMLIMSEVVLHDEFGFGEKRLKQFEQRFMDKVDCLQGGFTTWADQAKILADECGLKYEIRFNGEDPTK